MRRAAVTLALIAAAVAAPPARAGVVYGVCGSSICAVDDATGKKRTVLRGSSGGAYTAVGVSRSGRRMAFVRSEEVYRAGARGRRAERVGTALRQAAPDVNVRADGGEISWIDVVQRPDLIGGGFTQERDLIALRSSDPPSEGRVVAVDMFGAGFLGKGAIKQAFGDGDAPWFVCAIDPESGCGATVAADPQRALDQASGSADGRQVVAVATTPTPDGGAPSAASGAIALFDARTGRHVRDLAPAGALQPTFSPDGRRVAFVRGRDVYVVRTRGGRAKRLARGVSGPAWAQR
jgi:WD40 repeat protein